MDTGGHGFNPAAKEHGECNKVGRGYSRLAEIEDKIEASRQDASDNIGDLRDELRNSKADDK
jgi:hypothetical protein